MSRPADVLIDGIDQTVFRLWPHSVLMTVVWCACATVHAAQPLSDQELKQRYLAYGTEENQVVVIRQGVAEPRIPQLLPRVLRLIDLENTDNLLIWQEWQSLAVGANLGLQDTGRQVLASQPIANLGSEPFSLRWAGNLEQMIEVSRISGFALYGVDVELYNVSGGVRIQIQTF